MHKTRCSGLVHWFDSEKWGWEGDGKGVQGKKGKNKTKKNLNIQKTMIMASGPITSGQIDGKTVEAVTVFIFLGFKITAGGDCSHEIKRHLLLGRKAVINLNSMLKSRDITLPTKVHLVKAMVF